MELLSERIMQQFQLSCFSFVLSLTNEFGLDATNLTNFTIFLCDSVLAVVHLCKNI